MLNTAVYDLDVGGRKSHIFVPKTTSLLNADSIEIMRKSENGGGTVCLAECVRAALERHCAADLHK